VRKGANTRLRCAVLALFKAVFDVLGSTVNIELCEVACVIHVKIQPLTLITADDESLSGYRDSNAQLKGDVCQKSKGELEPIYRVRHY